MKKALMLLCLMLSTSVFAQMGAVLGIPEGTYTGSDIIVSQMPLVPNVEFTTTRTLHNGTITARTIAYLLGHEVGGASARLKIRRISPQKFQLEDLDRPDGKGGFIIAGDGYCTQRDCSFSVIVMGGSLHLRETWARGGKNEFFITDGWQSFNGVAGTYTSRLTK